MSTGGVSAVPVLGGAWYNLGFLEPPAPGAQNTKGAWDVFSTVVPVNASLLMLQMRGAGAATRDYLTDIGISNNPIINNILFSRGPAGNTAQGFFLVPISIASGVSLQARNQTGGGTDRLGVQAYVSTWQSPGLSTVETYGADVSDSGGTQVDPGGSAGVKGSYVQLTAATGVRVRWLIIAIGGQRNATRSVATWNLDIATGISSSEVVIIPDLLLTCDITLDTIYPQIWAMPVDIASGTRVAARASCDITDATDRTFDLAVYGCG